MLIKQIVRNKNHINMLVHIIDNINFDANYKNYEPHNYSSKNNIFLYKLFQNELFYKIPTFLCLYVHKLKIT